MQDRCGDDRSRALPGSGPERIGVGAAVLRLQPGAAVPGRGREAVRGAQRRHRGALGRPIHLRARIRTDVGRQIITDTQGRPPMDARELSGFIAKSSRQATTTVAGFDLTSYPSRACRRCGRSRHARWPPRSNRRSPTQADSHRPMGGRHCRCGPRDCVRIACHLAGVARARRSRTARTCRPRFHPARPRGSRRPGRCTLPAPRPLGRPRWAGANRRTDHLVSPRRVQRLTPWQGPNCSPRKPLAIPKIGCATLVISVRVLAISTSLELPERVIGSSAV